MAAGMAGRGTEDHSSHARAWKEGRGGAGERASAIYAGESKAEQLEAKESTNTWGEDEMMDRQSARWTCVQRVVDDKMARRVQRGQSERGRSCQI